MLIRHLVKYKAVKIRTKDQSSAPTPFLPLSLSFSFHPTVSIQFSQTVVVPFLFCMTHFQKRLWFVFFIQRHSPSLHPGCLVGFWLLLKTLFLFEVTSRFMLSISLSLSLSFFISPSLFLAESTSAKDIAVFRHTRHAGYRLGEAAAACVCVCVCVCVCAS